jgi:thioesterase domain-containing protein
MTCTLDALLIAYIDAIKRRQPAGPYVLGGWSSGGVFAFCAAQILLDRGDAIENLLLLDSPPLQVGSGLHRLPDQFYSHCTQVGVFGQIGGHARDKGEKGRAPPEWLVPHFKATIELLAEHCAGPLRVPVEVSMPSVALCWAGECALDGVRYAQLKAEETESEGVKFLAEKRKDFGLGSWAELLPGSKCHVKVLNGWDHFNMMVS